MVHAKYQTNGKAEIIKYGLEIMEAMYTYPFGMRL